MVNQYFLNTMCFQAKPEVVLTPPAKAFNPQELCAVWYNFALIKLLPVLSVCRCFPAASEAAIMTLLLTTLERFPLKRVQVHSNYKYWGWGRMQTQRSQPALPVVTMQNKSSSHIWWAGCGNQITAWSLAALAKPFPNYASGEKHITESLVSN